MEALAAALTPFLEQQKARQYGVGYKHDASGTPISIGYSHGPGGVLTFPGVDPTVFHTVMGNSSLLGQLPSMPSVYTNPTYLTITGVTDDTGSEKEDVCDDAPVAGLMKGCMLTSVFGRYERATPELELNRLGQRNDRADPLDLSLVGSPIASSGIFNSGIQSAAAPGDVLINEVSRKFWERNVSLWRLLSRQLWIGNPTNNTGGGGYKEMTGFSVLVNTGHHDAETNVSCPSLDSYLSNFNYGHIDSSGNNLVAAFTNVYHQLYRRAELTGMLPVRWVIAMRSQMFYELTAIWPCSYLSFRCATVLDQINPAQTGPMQGVIDAQDAIRFRDEMRAGKYLMIDGVRVEVVLDEGIPESTNTTNSSVASGCFSSDIYFIPMSVVGGRAVTYLEYFQYANPSLQDALGNMILGRIEGAFLTWPRQTNQCVVWQTKVEPRLVMRTPWLAGRLQNVVYCPIQHEPEPFPDDPYFVDGGKTSRVGPSLYSLWQN
jgi:hypothetical protein